MKVLSMIGNFLWFVLCGWWSGTLYLLIGGLFCITIVGIPIGTAMFQFAKLMYLPFGKCIVRESFVKGDISTLKKVFQTIINILWLPFGLTIFILNIGLILACFISIIMIPNGIVLARSCIFLLWPIGARVIKKDEANAIRAAR